MKYLKTSHEKCNQCHGCEVFCATTFFKVDDISKSAIIVDEKGITVCNQCGDCIVLCPAGAITTTTQGVVMIDKKVCVGCLICVAECPCGAMRYSVEQKIPFKCIACGGCVAKCPVSAIEIVKE
jgi:Fe-S-cluster-containing hydrogenase component 2